MQSQMVRNLFLCITMLFHRFRNTDIPLTSILNVYVAKDVPEGWPPGEAHALRNIRDTSPPPHSVNETFNKVFVPQNTLRSEVVPNGIRFDPVSYEAPVCRLRFPPVN